MATLGVTDHARKTSPSGGLDAVLVSSPLLVHGLRQPAEARTAVDGDTEDALWRQTSDVLRSHWPQPTPLPDTASAEEGLGISGNPYYFYVMRTHRTFGFVVFLFEDVGGEVGIPPTAVGATPFDSGGLWIGAIRPIKENNAKQDLFAAEEIPLARRKPDFLDYITSNYSAIPDYVGGKPPRIGVPLILNRSPNDPRAWTWEVRYPSELASTHLRLERTYMRRDDYEDYVDWLPRSDYEDTEISELMKLVGERVEVCDDGSMAHVRARAALREVA